MIPLLVLALLPAGIQAQSTTPQVVATGGDFYSNASGMLSLTVGELTAIETFSNGVGVLTQGFQQPEAQGVGVHPPEPGHLSFSFWPNPARDQVWLQFSAPANGEMTVQLYNALGQQLSSPLTLMVASGLVKQQVSLAGLAQGVYYLRLEFQAPGQTLLRSSQKIELIY